MRIDSRGTNQRASQRSDREQGHNETFAYGRKSTRRCNTRGRAGREAQQEVIHEQNVGNLASIILEWLSASSSVK